MGKLKDLVIDIQDMYRDGASVREIATLLEIEPDMVLDAVEMMDDPPYEDYDIEPETYDSDALASAGMGTDEDYGGAYADTYADFDLDF